MSIFHMKKIAIARNFNSAVDRELKFNVVTILTLNFGGNHLVLGRFRGDNCFARNFKLSFFSF